jgi:hypothetical protein
VRDIENDSIAPIIKTRSLTVAIEGWINLLDATEEESEKLSSFEEADVTRLCPYGDDILVRS